MADATMAPLVLVSWNYTSNSWTYSIYSRPISYFVLSCEDINLVDCDYKLYINLSFNIKQMKTRTISITDQENY